MKSVLVIGLGRFGRHLSRKFIEEGNAVLAIEKDETRADWAVNIVNEIQIGDATNEDFIKSLKVGGLLFVGATESINTYKTSGLEKLSPFIYKKI